MEIISCKDARARGLARYFTGKSCKKGHVTERYVAQSACVICTRDVERERYRTLDVVSRQQQYDSRKLYLRRWNESHPDRRRELNAKGKAAAKERNPEYFKQYYAHNKERRKHESIGWYEANKERHAARQKLYDAAHPEQVRAAKRRAANTRRARKLAAFIEVVDPIVVFQCDQGVCGICMKLVDSQSRWEVDHRVPLAKGGTHCYANVQLAHRRCNRVKHVKVAVCG